MKTMTRLLPFVLAALLLTLGARAQGVRYDNAAFATAVNGVPRGAAFPVASLAGDAIQHVAPEGSDANDGRSWGTAKATIAAANAALPNGGIIYYAGTTSITRTLVIGNATGTRAPVVLYMMPGSAIVENITNGTDGIQLTNNSTIFCPISTFMSSSKVTTGCTIYTRNSPTVHIRYMVGPNYRPQQTWNLFGVSIVPAWGRITAALNIDAQQPSVFEANSIWQECDGNVTYMVYVSGGGIRWVNNEVNAGNCGRTIPMYIANTATTNVSESYFTGGAMENAGAGVPNLVIDGDATHAGTINIRQLTFENVHMENHQTGANAPSYIVSIHSADHITFRDDQITGSPTNSFFDVYGAAATSEILFQNVGLAVGGGSPHFVNDRITSRTIPVPRNVVRMTSGTIHVVGLEIAGNTVNYSFPASFGPDGISSGVIAISAATSGSHTFATPYSTAPDCTASPTSDPGEVRWWVPPATNTAVTVDLSVSATITFTFTCTPAAN
jgi:hypothetical protein